METTLARPFKTISEPCVSLLRACFRTDLLPVVSGRVGELGSGRYRRRGHVHRGCVHLVVYGNGEEYPDARGFSHVRYLECSESQPDCDATVGLTLPSTQPWSGLHLPRKQNHNWLTVYPASGYGNATVTLQANGAGFAPGVYLAKIVVSASGSNVNTAPAIVNIPVVLTVGQSGAISVNGLQNAASFTQVYAPGMLMAVYGSNLSPGTQVATTIPLPTSLQA